MEEDTEKKNLAAVAGGGGGLQITKRDPRGYTDTEPRDGDDRRVGPSYIRRRR